MDAPTHPVTLGKELSPLAIIQLEQKSAPISVPKCGQDGSGTCKWEQGWGGESAVGQSGDTKLGASSPAEASRTPTSPLAATAGLFVSLLIRPAQLWQLGQQLPTGVRLVCVGCPGGPTWH